MIICDSHCDTLFKIVEGRDENLDITFDKLKKGGVNLQVMAMFVGHNNDIQTIKTRNFKMLNAFQKLINEGFIQTTDPTIINKNQINVMLSIEGCESITDLKDLEFYYKKGVRMIGITWNYENDYAYPAITESDKGLKPFAYDMIKEMQNLGIAIDVSHINEAGFFDIIEKFDMPPLASHSCAYSLCNHFRNLTDDQLKVLFEKGGYVGVNFFPKFLTKEENCDIDIVIDHIAYMFDKGGEGKVGFGSDFDGISSKPKRLNDPTGIPLLIERLFKRGFNHDEIKGIAGINFQKYYSRINNKRAN